MHSAKEQMSKIIHEQPDDSSYDEVLRELAFARITAPNQKAGAFWLGEFYRSMKMIC